jgi:DNA polymerase bacteriophage-type
MSLVTLDFETYFDTKFSLTKLSTMEYVKHPRFKVHGVGIKIDNDETQWYGADETQAALEEIDWSDSTLLAHNTSFDGYILTRYYSLIPRYYTDTAAISRALHPGQSASLKDCAIREFPKDSTKRKGDELIKTKGVHDLDPELEDILAGYCIQDVELTYALYKKMASLMPMDELDLIDMTCRMFCEPKFIVNLEALIAFRDETIARSEALIKAGGIAPKVLASNKMFPALIEELGIVVPTKVSPSTGKNIPALGKNDKAFTQMQKMYPEHQHIWDARAAVKSRINETRAQRFIDATHNDGTISVPLRYYAAHTGRFGGTEKINMQNMPRRSPLRLALGAPVGKLVYVADLSNIEARVLAWLAGEEELLEQFRSGADVYCNFGQQIYSREINKNDHPTERFVAKTAVLGLGYGMGATKFQNTLEAGAMGPAMKFSFTEALDVVSKYRNSFSGIPMLWKKLEDKLTSTINDHYYEEWRCLTFTDDKIYLPNGLALHYNNLGIECGKLAYDSRTRESTWGGRIAENVTQALSRLIITDAMLRIQADKTLDVDIVLTVHDEIVLIGSDQNPEEIMRKLIAHMCTPPVWAPDLPLNAEGGYDSRYSK